MSAVVESERVARHLIDEYNKGKPDWVETCHAENTEWIELPFMGGAGRKGGRAALRKAAEDSAVVFPDRQMDIINIVAGEGQAALEVWWTGTATQSMAWAEKGTKLKLRAVMILGIANGKVVKEIDYVIPMPPGT